MESMVRKKNEELFLKTIVDSVCFLTSETSHSLEEIRRMDFGSFLILLDYFERKFKAEKKALKKK